MAGGVGHVGCASGGGKEMFWRSRLVEHGVEEEDDDKIMVSFQLTYGRRNALDGSKLDASTTEADQAQRSPWAPAPWAEGQQGFSFRAEAETKALY